MKLALYLLSYGVDSNSYTWKQLLVYHTESARTVLRQRAEGRPQAARLSPRVFDPQPARVRVMGKIFILRYIYYHKREKGFPNRKNVSTA